MQYRDRPARDQVVCPSELGFIRRIVDLQGQGYHFYYLGSVEPSERKRALLVKKLGRELTPRDLGRYRHQVDTEMPERYLSKRSVDQRYRAKRKGEANTYYFRHGSMFVVMSTKGKGALFSDHGGVYQKSSNPDARVFDIREVPLRVSEKFSISRVEGPDGKCHARVRFTNEYFQARKAFYLELCLRRTAAELVGMVFNDPNYYPYTGVRRQMLGIVRAMTEARKVAGLQDALISYGCVRKKLDSVKQFEQYTFVAPRRKKAA